MARDFDGNNDRISFGADASIADFKPRTYAMWWLRDGTGGSLICAKGSGGTSWVDVVTSAGTALNCFQQWSGTDVEENCGTSVPSNGAFGHIVVSYDGSNAANHPVVYVNGVLQTNTPVTGPGTGSFTSDAATNLVIGETVAGTVDLDGAVQYFNYANAAWSADQANRHRWYGRAGGAIAVNHPLLTTKLTNEGTATANGTATQTSVRSYPRGERCWGSMMGMGR